MTRTGRPRKPATKAKSVQMSLRMDVALRQQFESFAEADGLELSDLLRLALREYAARRTKTRAAA